MRETLTKTTVLLIDGHNDVLSALSRRLKKVDDLEVIAETGSPSRGLDLVGRLKPNLIIVDFGSVGAYGAAICARVRQTSPDSMLVVYTPYADDETRRMYAEAGAAACLLKDIGFENLVSELRTLISKNKASRASPPVQPAPESGE
jgi:DNA-binding NarL/FixJ family response regulator